MTDFFADLERHVLDAARRDVDRRPLARLRPTAGPLIRVLAMAAAGAAAIAAVAAVLTVADRSGVSEREAPAGGAGAGCSAEPPRETLDALAVLRRERRDADRLPAPALAALESDGGAARLYPEHARRARVHGSTSFFVAPALARDGCEGAPQPAACLAAVERSGAATTWPCQTLDELRAHRGANSHAPNAPGSIHDRAPYVLSAIVLDGEEEERGLPLRDGAWIPGSTESNLFLADGHGTDAESMAAAQGRAADVKALSQCAPGGQTVQSNPAPEEITRAFAVLSRPNAEDPPEFTLHAPVRVLFARDAVVVSVYVVVPVLLDGDGRCATDDLASGVCLGRTQPQEDPVELRCASLDVVLREGLELRQEGRNGVEVAVLVPDGVTAVRMDNAGACGTRAVVDWPVRANIMATTLLTHLRCSEVVSLRRGS